MPVDLLRYVSGPTPYSSWWLGLAGALLVVIILWYVGVLVLTAPNRHFRDLPLIGAARGELIRRRFARAVHAIGQRHRAGTLAAAPAGEAVSQELRGFLQQITGMRAEYMQLDAIAGSSLAAAAPLLAELNDAQFNADSTADVGAVCDSAEELIRTWS